MIKVRHIRSTIAVNAVAVAVALSHGAVVPTTPSRAVEPAAASHHGLARTTPAPGQGERIVLAGMRCPYRAC